MSELMNRLKKASTLEYAGVMKDSEIYNNREFVKTPIPGLNIAYSGDVNGGLTSGLHVWAGPSRHFKSLFCLISAASYLHQYPEAVCIFYDNEFGTPKEYFASVGIDPARVLHSPFLTLEDLRTDIVNQLNTIKRGDKVVIVVDSLGLAASEKEVKDAEEGNEKADMTRAKVNKSLFRIVTPHLRLKDLPMIVVQHTYVEQKMYGKTIVSGGTGTMLAADNVYIVGREQEKEGAVTVGYNFIINIEKSRFVTDKAKIPITVLKKGGISRYSGLFDIAMECGIISRLNVQTYKLEVDLPYFPKTFKRKEVELDNHFWVELLNTEEFPEAVRKLFKVATGKIIADDPESFDEDEFNTDEESDLSTVFLEG